MPGRLLALCGRPTSLQPKIVRLSDEAKNQVRDLLQVQERQFLKRPSNDFFDHWVPESVEVSRLPALQDGILADLLQSGREDLHRAPLPFQELEDGNIRALCMFFEESDERPNRLLVQHFGRAQILSKGLPFIQSSDTFQRLESSAFCMGSDLLCIIDHSHVHAGSMHFLSAIIDTDNFVRTASDEQVESFALSTLILVSDVEGFTNQATKRTRHEIHSILSKGVLERHTVDSLQAEAAKADLALPIENGRIAIPTDKKRAMEVIQFLNDKRFQGPASGQTFRTNSIRPTKTTNSGQP